MLILIYIFKIVFKTIHLCVSWRIKKNFDYTRWFKYDRDWFFFCNHNCSSLATPRQDWTGSNPSRREGGGCGFTLSRSHSCCAVRLVYTQISPGHIWTTLYYNVTLSRVTATIVAVKISKYLFSEWVSVVLGIYMLCASAILSSVACPAVQYFSTLSQKRRDFRKLVNAKYLFGFFLKILSETVFILRTERDMITNVYWSACKVKVR